MGMQLLTQSYDLLELQQLRSELERRGIKVLIADEFTYAIPGMPGAERPRRVLVAQEDIAPARQVVADLLGQDRIHTDDANLLNEEADVDAHSPIHKRASFLWLIAGLLIVGLVVLSAQ